MLDFLFSLGFPYSKYLRFHLQSQALVLNFPTLHMHLGNFDQANHLVQCYLFIVLLGDPTTY